MKTETVGGYSRTGSNGPSPSPGPDMSSPIVKASPSSAPELRPSLHDIPRRPPVPTLSLSRSPPEALPSATAKVEELGTKSRIIRRRAGIACRRCRRMRSKCVHDKSKSPCQACLEAGLGPEECVFPVRGEPENDREFRHPRSRASKTPRRDPLKARREILDDGLGTIRPGSAFTSVDLTLEWENLPPIPEIIEGIQRFTQHYFQLGFIHKSSFTKRLADNPRSVSVFLIEAILSISARMSPKLGQRYGSGLDASAYFMGRAAQLAYGEIYETPTLERCQAFYLLSIAQQGNGLRNKSYINLGVSMRMAALMRLHREETYQLENAGPELIIRAESARRTLWMLHSQDQLHSSIYSPVSLAASDITALLPCEEDEFEQGVQSWRRAALEDMPPALENPLLVNAPDRSLFASLMQAHQFWGISSRQSMNLARSSRPWDITSKYAIMVSKLRCWEHALPRHHRWSRYTLNHFKILRADLAYLGVTMIPRLCNLVLRRPYLEDIIRYTAEPGNEKQYFYSCLGLELSWNVYTLYEQIDGQFTGRDPDENVGAQMAGFCVYSCGVFIAYICKYPHICPDDQIRKDAPNVLRHIISILHECALTWPIAKRWLESLITFSENPSNNASPPECSMADGRDHVPHPVSVSPAPPSVYSCSARSSLEATPRSLEARNPSCSSQSTQSSHTPSALSPLNLPPVPKPYPWTYGQLPPHIPLPDPQSNLYIHFNPGYTSQRPRGLPLAHMSGLDSLIDAFDPSDLPPPDPAPPPVQGFGDTLVPYIPPNDGFDEELKFFCFEQGDGLVPFI